MSRIIAQSLVADLVGRFWNIALFCFLLPVVLLVAGRQQAGKRQENPFEPLP